jgi:hypothetical protein
MKALEAKIKASEIAMGEANKDKLDLQKVIGDLHL